MEASPPGGTSAVTHKKAVASAHSVPYFQHLLNVFSTSFHIFSTSLTRWTKTAGGTSFKIQSLPVGSRNRTLSLPPRGRETTHLRGDIGHQVRTTRQDQFRFPALCVAPSKSLTQPRSASPHHHHAANRETLLLHGGR